MPILAKEISTFPQTLFEDSSCDSDPGDRNWWVIFTRARHEKALARDLLKFEIPFFLPLVPRKYVIRKKLVESHIPLFSGYVFMFCSDNERVRALTTNRITELLEVDDQRQLRRDLTHLSRLIENGTPLTLQQWLEPGRRVRVTNGSLKGLEGIVKERRGGHRRLIVAVEFLQNSVSLEIDDYLVEPA